MTSFALTIWAYQLTGSATVLALVGYTGGARSVMRLQPGCPEGTLTMTAAHEFGHVLGLVHEDRRCALMNSVFPQWSHTTRMNFIPRSVVLTPSGPTSASASGSVTVNSSLLQRVQVI